MIVLPELYFIVGDSGDEPKPQRDYTLVRRHGLGVQSLDRCLTIVVSSAQIIGTS